MCCYGLGVWSSGSFFEEWFAFVFALLGLLGSLGVCRDLCAISLVGGGGGP